MKRIACRWTALVLLLLLCVSCTAPDKALSGAERLDLGEQYLLELDYDRALVQFLAVIEIEPMNPRGYTGAAEAYLALGDTDRAVEVLQRGLERLPDEDSIAELLLSIREAPPMAEDAEAPEDDAVQAVYLSADSQLRVEILGSHRARISITDNNLQPSYVVRTESDGDYSGWDCYWGVDFYRSPEDGIYGVRTFSPKRRFDVGRQYAVSEMEHEVNVYEQYEYLAGERGGWSATALTSEVRFSLNGNTLMWEFVIDDDEFLGDMRQMDHFVVEILKDDGYITESYLLRDGTLHRMDFEDFEVVHPDEGEDE